MSHLSGVPPARGEVLQGMRPGVGWREDEPVGPPLGAGQLAALARGRPQGGVTIRTRWVPWS